MESDKDYIKKVFSSKLSSFEPDLPDSVWNRIEKGLEKPLLTPVVKQKRFTIQKAILVVSGVAAVIAIALLTLHNSFESENIDPKGLADKFEVKTDGIIEKDNQTNSDIESTLLLPSNNVVASLPSKASVVLSNNVEATEFKSNPCEINEDNVNPQDETISNVGLGWSNETKHTPGEADLADTHSFDDFDKELEEQIAAFEREGDALMNVLADNTPILSKKNNEGYSLGVAAGSGFNKSNDSKNQFNTTYNGAQYSGVVLLRTQKIKLEHNQPITFGINISKRLSPKLSLESGITYTYLSSRMKSDEQSDIQQYDRQYFNYFGIPLTVNYTFAEWKKMKFYTSFGGMIQKDFYGRISSNMYVDGLIGTEENRKEKISQKNPQFSSMATLGVSYPLYKDIRVYGNFGGAYYFDAKNQYETIYSDKKWLFNMNLGLRFEF